MKFPIFMQIHTIIIIILSLITLTLVSKIYGKNLITNRTKKFSNISNEEFNGVINVKNTDIGEYDLYYDFNLNNRENTSNASISTNLENDNKELKMDNSFSKIGIKRNKRTLRKFFQIINNSIINSAFYFIENYDLTCKEDPETFSEYTGNNIYKIYTNCNKTIVYKELANTSTIESGMNTKELCFSSTHLLPLGRQTNMWEEDFFYELFSSSVFYSYYDVIAKKLNSIIAKKYDNKYILTNYIKACNENDFFANKAKVFNQTCTDFIESHGRRNIESIISSYVIENQRSFYVNWFSKFAEANKSTENHAFGDIEKYVFIDDTDHKQYVIQEKNEVCNEFSYEIKYIFPILDKDNIIYKSFIRTFLINNLSIKPVQHFELYNYYANNLYHGIFNYVKPVKKCIYQLCIVLYPYKIYYGNNGCNRIEYQLYNGEKEFKNPQLIFFGNFTTAIKHYNFNLNMALLEGLYESELFDNEFMKDSIFTHLVDIDGFQNTQDNLNCLNWAYLNVSLTPSNNLANTKNEIFKNGFFADEDCLDSYQLEDEKYSHYFLNGDII